VRSFVIGGRKVDSEGPEAKVEWQGAARDAIESHREVVLRVRDQELRLKCHYPHAKPGFKPKIVPKSKTARISRTPSIFILLPYMCVVKRKKAAEAYMQLAMQLFACPLPRKMALVQSHKSRCAGLRTAGSHETKAITMVALT